MVYNAKYVCTNFDIGFWKPLVVLEYRDTLIEQCALGRYRYVTEIMKEQRNEYLLRQSLHWKYMFYTSVCLCVREEGISHHCSS